MFSQTRSVVYLISLFALTLMIAACSNRVQASKVEDDLNSFKIEVDGLRRSYSLHVPDSYDPNQATALVFVFHGGGGNASNAVKMTGFVSQADKAGFIVVFPEGSGRLEEKLHTWNGGTCCGYAQTQNIDDVNFVASLLDELSLKFNIDPKRVYATGMSNGAIMSYRLACELSDRIAAIGPVAATQNIEVCQPGENVSVVHFHGTADQNAPYEGGVGKKSISGVDFNSVQASLDFWIAHNQCDDTPIIEKVSDHVTRSTYANCTDDHTVELYTVEEGGHAWPGGQPGFILADKPTDEISATALMWDFFVAHPKP